MLIETTNRHNHGANHYVTSTTAVPGVDDFVVMIGFTYELSDSAKVLTLPFVGVYRTPDDEIKSMTRMTEPDIRKSLKAKDIDISEDTLRDCFIDQDGFLYCVGHTTDGYDEEGALLFQAVVWKCVIHENRLISLEDRWTGLPGASYFKIYSPEPGSELPLTLEYHAVDPRYQEMKSPSCSKNSINIFFPT